MNKIAILLMIALAFGSKTQIFKNSFLQQEEGAETTEAQEQAQEAASNAGQAIVDAINEVIAQAVPGAAAGANQTLAQLGAQLGQALTIFQQFAPDQVEDLQNYINTFVEQTSQYNNQNSQSLTQLLQDQNSDAFQALMGLAGQLQQFMGQVMQALMPAQAN